MSLGYLSQHDRTAWLMGGDATCRSAPNSPLGRVWRIILLGAPGVGKGTQAELICERLNSCHLSTGDVFRAAKCSGTNHQTTAMQAALDYMRRGELVPDHTVLDLVSERIRCLRCSGGFLLDGFPRTVAQAEALDRLLKQEGVALDTVLNHTLPLERIIARISGRLTCAQCKSVFHRTTRPPQSNRICDHCGGELIQREDDHPEAVAARMKIYESNANPLIEFYERRGLLVNVSAEGSPEEIFQRTREAALAK